MDFDLQLLAQGAEGRVYSSTFLGKPAIVKERFSKKYRLPVLDTKITKTRIIQESRCLLKAKQAGVDVCGIWSVDTKNSRIVVEKIEGQTVKHFLYGKPAESWKKEICEKIGISIARLHDAGIIHGDLTTSNMMIRNENGSLTLIDFGLASSKCIHEDKAVDLYVLERALLSTHTDSEALFEIILASYKEESKNSSPVMKRFEKVRQRGRKRLAFG
eukprot:TRINITY_DN338223_c0_g1_i1.p1 TRINITY_DN338223_c0_g1~~TRINITY_DN338223_c0_g1_i1.p1  ORF type:complete len:227 (-),score=36.32 TRINITY_DN338223_c0_g1_i1:130-777(-)